MHTLHEGVTRNLAAAVLLFVLGDFWVFPSMCSVAPERDYPELGLQARDASGL